MNEAVPTFLQIIGFVTVGNPAKVWAVVPILKLVIGRESDTVTRKNPQALALLVIVPDVVTFTDNAPGPVPPLIK